MDDLLSSILNFRLSEENPPKTQDAKTKMLKQFIESQIDEDKSRQDQSAWIRKGTLERNIQVTSKDITRIDLTVKVVINFMPETATRMMTDNTELLGTVDQSEDPVKKRRMAHPEGIPYGERISIYPTD